MERHSSAVKAILKWPFSSSPDSGDGPASSTTTPVLVFESVLNFLLKRSRGPDLSYECLRGGDLPEVVTAESLMLLPGGHVDLRAPQATGPPRARAPRHEMPYYLPPEVLAQQTHLLHDDVEKERGQPLLRRRGGAGGRGERLPEGVVAAEGDLEGHDAPRPSTPPQPRRHFRAASGTGRKNAVQFHQHHQHPLQASGRSSAPDGLLLLADLDALTPIASRARLLPLHPRPHVIHRHPATSDLRRRTRNPPAPVFGLSGSAVAGRQLATDRWGIWRRRRTTAGGPKVLEPPVVCRRSLSTPGRRHRGRIQEDDPFGGGSAGGHVGRRSWEDSVRVSAPAGRPVAAESVSHKHAKTLAKVQNEVLLDGDLRFF
ncbi:uncharacterized protein LOC143028101 [Oratosquilla oratoria]|uniref:uncharacterized protein LOC143028101 n=1 Tax=Oratosquilla oratoria TaxID=337810 RepID=UPI003F757F12